MAAPDPADFVTLAELRERLPCSERTLRALLKARGVEVLRRRMIALEELRAKWPLCHASILLVRASC